VRTKIFATPASCGLLNYRRRPAPRSQGCEVRASSVILDTGTGDKFPNGRNACCLWHGLEKTAPAASRS